MGDVTATGPAVDVWGGVVGQDHAVAQLQAAAEHRGTALVEIFQDCPIFNDGSFDVLRKPDTAAERLVPLTHGEPIRFGPPAEDGLGSYAVVQEGFGLRVAKTDEVDAAQIVTHDAEDLNLAFALSRLSDQDLTHTVTGIFRNTDRTTYDDAARAQRRDRRVRRFFFHPRVRLAVEQGPERGFRSRVRRERHERRGERDVIPRRQPRRPAQGHGRHRLLLGHRVALSPLVSVGSLRMRVVYSDADFACSTFFWGGGR